MRMLKLGLSGPDVKKWQIFLIGQGVFSGATTSQFDEATQAATKEFQKLHKLDVDGRVGNQTFGTAMRLGFEVVPDDDPSRFGPTFRLSRTSPPSPQTRRGKRCSANSSLSTNRCLTTLKTL